MGVTTYVLIEKLKIILSYNVPVIQWIMSSQKSCEQTCNNTLAHTHNIIDSVHFSNVFLEIMFILKVIKSHFRGSYDKQNLTLGELVIILYEIYETRQRLFLYEMTTCVRFSIFPHYPQNTILSRALCTRIKFMGQTMLQ